MTAAVDAVPAVLANAADTLTRLNDFKGRWYGSLPSNPAVDPLGNPLTEGDVYYNSTANELRVYTSFAWQPMFTPTYAYDEDRLIDACARARRAL
ncbi:hypothetical protein [Bradyrhizobium paxllaeri]|uniref:hypothetical protein n=1 Tax=Bradyrhizobium paxllaeri TaxID=190148 RepID=UPI00081086C9|nr:hypothetical protein [Bradyrhizobium paxllaeri]